MTKPAPKLGILQLNTTFPRPVGDVGHVGTWGDTPVVIKVVEEAEITSVVDGSWGEDLVEAFVREGKKCMKEENCVAFVTSCGFLATMHPTLSRQLPFMGTSSLMQVAWLQTSFLPVLEDGKHQVGVITFKKASLTQKHFEAVRAHPSTPVEGVPQPGIFSSVLGETIPYDHQGMAKEMKEAASLLVERNPQLKAIVLECTNMPPFAKEVHEVTGLPVYDVIGLGQYLYKAACPKSYA
ncbi:uncharacterized protein IL334_003030 [Kwoniella shivajii]|uniref:Aspartate racemase n=1 Tax=Kwoniella shivajii TaxID=564305 RepID=A0ABZ1CXJ4_9TREE|nr:hypothetical protein IL334_003030 [Kwoniella shivajii]